MFDPVIRSLLMAQLTAKRALTGRRSEDGATSVEYGLLVTLIAGVIVLAVTAFGTKVSDLFTTVTGVL